MKINIFGEIMYAIKDMFSKNGGAKPTLLLLDINGTLAIESFAKMLNYNEKELSFISGKKQIYIYGDNLSVQSFTNENMTVTGIIEKIELFEVCK